MRAIALLSIFLGSLVPGSFAARAASASQFDQLFLLALRNPHTLSKHVEGPVRVAEVRMVGAQWSLRFVQNTETRKTTRFFCTETCEEVH